MGLGLPTTSNPSTRSAAIGSPISNIRGWFSTLSPRDQTIYTVMLGMLTLIVAIYLFVGTQTLLGRQNGGTGTHPTNVIWSSAQPPTPAPPTSRATTIAPTPTDLPTSVPSPEPSDEPTPAALIIPPTQSSALAQATAQPAGTSIATLPSQTAPIRATGTPPRQGSPSPTRTSTATARTTTLATITITHAPVATPTRTTGPQPTAPATAVEVSNEVITLYFADTTGTLYVPVQRSVRVANRQVAQAAVRELIAGPRNGLKRLVLPDVQLLALTIDADGTAFVNFDRPPTGQGDARGSDAIALTLTHFSSIRRVQLQINAQNLGGARGRPILNPINPQNLPNDYNQTEFLPVYFPSNDDLHDIRMIRMVQKTKQTAEGTMRALLEGPGSYSYAVRRVIPAGTELRGIRLENGVALVDLTKTFLETQNREAAIRTAVASLTTLPSINGVQFLVEGRSLGEQWGGSYGKVFTRPVINPE